MNLAKYEHWSRGKLDAVTDPDHRQAIERYIRWHHLRRLREQARTAPVPNGSFLRAKQYTTVAIDFVNWLTRRGRTLAECDQHEVDAWFAGGTTTRRHAVSFLQWAAKQRLAPQLSMPATNARTSPALGENQRINALREVLLHDGLPTPLRVIAALVLLYGQSLSRIVSLQLDDVHDQDDKITIRLAADWVEVPSPVAEIVRRHIAHRPGLNTAANQRSPLLFPGKMPGRPLHVYSVANMLRSHGIPALAARSGTWLQLVRETPPAILSEALGVTPATAMRYAERAGSDYLGYATSR